MWNVGIKMTTEIIVALQEGNIGRRQDNGDAIIRPEQDSPRPIRERKIDDTPKREVRLIPGFARIVNLAVLFCASERDAVCQNLTSGKNYVILLSK